MDTRSRTGARGSDRNSERCGQGGAGRQTCGTGGGGGVARDALVENVDFVLGGDEVGSSERGRAQQRALRIRHAAAAPRRCATAHRRRAPCCPAPPAVHAPCPHLQRLDHLRLLRGLLRAALLASRKHVVLQYGGREGGRAGGRRSDVVSPPPLSARSGQYYDTQPPRAGIPPGSAGLVQFLEAGLVVLPEELYAVQLLLHVGLEDLAPRLVLVALPRLRQPGPPPGTRRPDASANPCASGPHAPPHAPTPAPIATPAAPSVSAACVTPPRRRNEGRQGWGP